MKKQSLHLWLCLCALLICGAAHSDENVLLAKGGGKGTPANAGSVRQDESSSTRLAAEIANGVALPGEKGIPGLDTYPRVSGSTSTIPLGQLLAARALNLDAELRRIAVEPDRNYFGIQGSTLILSFPLDIKPARLNNYNALIARNSHRQTSESYLALARGELDLILVAREPSPDELKAAQTQRMAFDIRPAAMDALVFIANNKNQVNNLSMAHIRGIYGGTLKKWHQVGGKPNPITVITRDRNSGSEELMKKLVMQNRKTITGGSRMIATMIGTLDAVERDEQALAYAVYYYERFMNPREGIKALSVDGVAPTSEAIANRTYPLIEPVYVVTRKDIAKDGPVATLRDWLLSTDGQMLVGQSGYVPIGG